MTEGYLNPWAPAGKRGRGLGLHLEKGHLSERRAPPFELLRGKDRALALRRASVRRRIANGVSAADVLADAGGVVLVHPFDLASPHRVALALE